PNPAPSDLSLQDLTVEQLHTLIRTTVEELLLEFLGDPDRGLPLNPEIQQQLLLQQQRQLTGNQGFSTLKTSFKYI
ncbi:hypothetical protein, partial [Trichothermofontia sp.]